VDDLLLKGVSDTVFMDIRDGSYTVNKVLYTIPGSTYDKPVIFRSQSGNRDNVNLYHVAADQSDNYVVKLYGADFIHFRNLGFSGNIASNATYSTAFNLEGGVEDFQLLNCKLTGTTNVSSYASLYTASNSTGTRRIIEGNWFVNGYYGLYQSGVNTNILNRGSVIRDNQFDGISGYGLFVQYESGLKLLGNTINSIPSYGLYLNYCNDDLEIIGNRIKGNSYGLYLISSTAGTGQGSARGLVANNFVYSNGSYAMYLYNSSNQDIYYNSVNMRSNNAQSSAFYIYLGNTNNVVNNNFAHKGSGYSYYAATPAAINTSDYNNFYCRGTNSAHWNGNHTTLASFQSASGKDGNSVATNPGYFSDTDLHAVSVEINGKATPLARVLDDIDGEPRDASTPDIGADEFDSTAVVSIDDEYLAGERIIPQKFAVYANYPNPFNPSTFIRYDLPQAVHVTLDVYNILGQHVERLVDEVQPAGAHVFKFDASKLSSGVYYYRITAGSFSKVHKMILQR
jgi:hypothetical protein